MAYQDTLLPIQSHFYFKRISIVLKKKWDYFKNYNTIQPFKHTNGQVERFIQTLKKSLRNANTNNLNFDAALQRILLQYRVMPHSGTNVSPSK